MAVPWDLEQTHQTLVPYVIEEAYEVVDAIEQDDTPGLADELGDLLLQVLLHAEVADQNGEFEWNDVIRGLSAKLLRRHPHVFGEVAVRDADDVVRNWDLLKAAERSDQPQPASALDGIPKSLPALKYAAEQARKASKTGFDWPTRDGTLDKVREELAELLAAETVAERREELGDLLWIIAKLAMLDGIDAEEALRAVEPQVRQPLPDPGEPRHRTRLALHGGPADLGIARRLDRGQTAARWSGGEDLNLRLRAKREPQWAAAATTESPFECGRS